MFLTFSIVTVFLLGYSCIALENGLKVNKAAIGLLMCVVCWTLYMFGAPEYVAQFHSEDFAKFLEVFHMEDSPLYRAGRIARASWRCMRNLVLPYGSYDHR